MEMEKWAEKVLTRYYELCPPEERTVENFCDWWNKHNLWAPNGPLMPTMKDIYEDSSACDRTGEQRNKDGSSPT